ncbi:MAG: D-xylose 1-dehydrogenase D-xylono,5-lactone-forming [Solirubrobacteraceae bacterium]|jgi:predicted dehydrogenase|nr:D-xylose 1-dehydrogenase D-xylono,5-lactone-forming [Solirubrobacteraceae bacterium]
MTNWGVLGAARINQQVLEGAALAEGASVVAIAARDRDRAQAQADAHSIPTVYGSYDELLADPEIDAVYIPLPNALHVPWAVRSLEAGKHVLCEKPLARSEAEARRAFAAARQANKLLMEAFMWRHTPQTKRLSELLDEGAVGRVRVVRATFGFRLEGEGDVRLSHELEGGALMDVGCYCVSAARLVAGEPVHVRAEQVSSTPTDGVDVRLAATMRFPDDVLSVIDCALDAPLGHRLTIVGSDGELVLEDPFHARSPGILHDGQLIEVPFADPYAVQIENFSAAIRGEAEPLLDGRDAVAQAAVIEALYRSAEAT